MRLDLAVEPGKIRFGAGFHLQYAVRLTTLLLYLLIARLSRPNVSCGGLTPTSKLPNRGHDWPRSPPLAPLASPLARLASPLARLGSPLSTQSSSSVKENFSPSIRECGVIGPRRLVVLPSIFKEPAVRQKSLLSCRKITTSVGQSRQTT